MLIFVYDFACMLTAPTGLKTAMVMVSVGIILTSTAFILVIRKLTDNHMKDHKMKWTGSGLLMLCAGKFIIYTEDLNIDLISLHAENTRFLNQCSTSR